MSGRDFEPDICRRANITTPFDICLTFFVVLLLSTAYGGSRFRAGHLSGGGNIIGFYILWVVLFLFDCLLEGSRI